MDLERTAASINVLVEFCGRRDVPRLTRDELAGTDGIADVAVLFGGSIVAGGDVLAAAIREGIARHYMIVGSEGHTTAALRSELARRMGWGDLPPGQTEADLFDRYLRERHGLAVDLLERRSTNCGNNVTNALALLRREGIAHDKLVFIQDATMQQRMDAVLRLHAPDTQLINFASHQTKVAVVREKLTLAHPPIGMWSLQQYITLLMGEVPRLTDDEHGYGPQGWGFIAHVNVPQQVVEAFDYLGGATSFEVRVADARWAG